MDHPVDLIHLERLTNKDKAAEQEVFKDFFKEADLHIRAMIRVRQEVSGKGWSNEVLALRAKASHVGAIQLVEFLSVVEGDKNTSSDVREMQVKSVLREIGKIREFAEKRSASQ